MRAIPLLTCTFLVVMGCVAGNNSNGSNNPMAQEQAQKIAEKSFREYTKGKITKYSVTMTKENSNTWEFFFQGREEFARPGFHWTAKIDKKTGKVEIQSGE